MTASPRVYSIPPERAFGDALAEGILSRYGGSSEELAAVRILLPTRRACRALGEAFLRATAGRPLLLPAMTPIGDIDEDELFFGGAGSDLPGALDLPPAIPALRRQLLLTRLVMARPSVDGGAAPSPAHAARLAAELARLLDEVQTERLDFRRLADIVPDRFADHWQKTIAFLEIVTANWPAILDEQGCLDPADRRNQLVAAQIAHWQQAPPATPVIAAGSTGSQPATADLLACVASLETGALVLPGLDRTLDPDSIAALAAGHPQFGMMRIVRRLGLEPAEIGDWTPAGAAGHGRTDFVNIALRPPATAAAAAPGSDIEGAFAGVGRIQCTGLQQEAGVIALMMREALEVPDRTAALVTPDRRLARRVAAELQRWGIDIDDSAGVPLAATMPGIFLRLTADAAAAAAAPVPLLAMLKHPLAAGGLAPAAFRERVREMECRVLRGVRPPPGFAALHDALRLQEPESGVTRWAGGLAALARPLETLMARPSVAVADLVDAHVGFAEALAASDAEDGPARLWAGDAGDAAHALVAELRAAADAMAPIRGRDWPAFLDALMAGAVVRPQYGRHPRLHIWGLLEARLQQADLVILGGLNEGVWPPDPGADPWMSRQMRAAFGLPPAERRIGLSAHDFVQSFAAPDVVLSRSTRVDGSPTVPARWMTRLETMMASTEAGGRVLERWRSEESTWLRRFAGQDLGLPRIQIRAPAPVPPVAARPARLPVTDVELLIRDPYAIYAKRILGLRALDPIDADPGAADRGSIIHAAIDRFFAGLGGGFPDDALARLLAAGEAAFGPLIDRPGIRAFWWPRFERIAGWIVDHERGRRDQVAARHTETKGALAIRAGERAFELTAIADRIDVLADGTLAIIDYKTGRVPSRKDVKAGLSPQLPLEAAIASAGGFPGIAPAAVSALWYWKLSGGDPAGEVKEAGDDPDELADQALGGLADLIRDYGLAETPYPARPDPETAPAFSDYEHLERLQEWATALGGGE